MRQPPAPPPEPRQWVTCPECERPGHPPVSAIGRDGIWFCADCTNPAWRQELPASDPRHRAPGMPVRPVFDPEAFGKYHAARGKRNAGATA